MREANLTQRKLAEKMGITNPVVSVWLTGKRNPKPDTLRRIAEATGKPYSFFMEEDFFTSVKAIPLTPSNTVQLPILADVPAGLPEYSDRDVEMFVDIPRFLFPGADFVVKCIGDSLEPKIHKGDYCVIRKTSEAIDRRPMLVKTEGGVCMKVIRKLKSGIKLYSINPAYEPIVATDLQIIGLIIGHWSRDDRESWG